MEEVTPSEVTSVIAPEYELDIRINETIFSDSALCSMKEQEQEQNVTVKPKRLHRPDPANDQVIRGMAAALFDCQFCKTKMTGLNRLDAHLRKVHTAKIFYTCHICQLKIWQVNLLKRHLRSHENQEKMKNDKLTSKASRRKRISKKKDQNKSVSKTSDEIICTENTDSYQVDRNEISSQQQLEKVSCETLPIVLAPQNELPIWEDFVPNDDGGPDHANDDEWGWDTDLLLPENRLSDLNWIPNVPPISTETKFISTANVSDAAIAMLFPCSKCTEVFDSKRFYDIHQSCHNLKISADMQCTKCHARFKTLVTYKGHVRSHRRVVRGKVKRMVTNIHTRMQKKKKIPCGECGHILRSASELKMHMQKHTGIKLFNCDECGAKFSAPASLRRHQRQHQVDLLQQGVEIESDEGSSHSKDEIVDDTIEVPRVTGSGRKLRTLKVVRYGQDPSVSTSTTTIKKNCKKKHVQCPSCDHLSRNQSELQIHMQNHTGVKLFKCHSCNKNCTTRNSLIRHIRLAHSEIRPHPCSHCNKTFASPVDLKSHQRYHSLGKNFRCSFEQCNKRFALKNHLVDHMRRHTGERPFQCEEEGCEKAFMSSTELRRHSRSHMSSMVKDGIPVPDSGTYLYNCKECDRGFTSLDNYHRHQKIHDPNRRTYLCDLCGKKYFTKSALVYHSISHEEEKTIPCKLCPKKFQTPYSLSIHEKVSHERSRRHLMGNFICDICGKTLKSQGSLRTHMERHTDEKKYICEQCGKGCATRGDLKFHTFTHFPVKPFKCEFCDYRCTHPSNINHHVAQDHMGTDGIFREYNVQGKEKSFICFTCGEGWTNQKALEHHQLYHIGAKDVPCRKCEERFVTKYDLWIHAKVHRISSASMVACINCGKSFSSKAGLDLHMRYKHTGEAPFGCSSCDRRFKSRQDLKYHSYSHTGNYPFACSVCGKRAGSRGNLNAHMRTHQKGSTSSTKPQINIRCIHCDESFKTRALLKKHTLAEHRIQEVVDEGNLQQSMEHNVQESDNNNDSSSLSVQQQEVQTITMGTRVQSQDQDPPPGFQLNYSQFFTTTW